MAFKIRSFSALGAIVVVASAAVLSIAVAGPTSVPFKASLVTQEVLHLDPATCRTVPYLVGVTTGSGHASHLGAITVIASDCVIPPPLGGAAFMFANGKLTVTAANGDELSAEYGGTFTPTATPPIYLINGTYRIIGGTGRFSGASGLGTLQGIENLVTFQGQVQLSGTISY